MSRSGRRDVHLACGSQDAQNHAGGAGILCQLDVAFHRAKFTSAVEKVAAAWPDHAMDRDRNAGHYLFQQTKAGRNAAAGKLTAQLDAVRAAAVRDLCVLEGLNANLELG